MPKIAVIFFVIALLAVSLVPISGVNVQDPVNKFEAELKKIAFEDTRRLMAQLEKERFNSFQQQAQDFEQTVKKHMQGE